MIHILHMQTRGSGLGVCIPVHFTFPRMIIHSHFRYTRYWSTRVPGTRYQGTRVPRYCIIQLYTRNMILVVRINKSILRTNIVVLCTVQKRVCMHLPKLEFYDTGMIQVVRCPQSTVLGVHDFVVAKKLEIIIYVYTVACFEQIHIYMKMLGRINVARSRWYFNAISSMMSKKTIAHVICESSHKQNS